MCLGLIVCFFMLSRPSIFGFLVAFALMLSPFAVAGTLGVLTYEIIGGTEVKITDCATTASGALVVPDTIEGLPVTSVGNSAFYFCGQLTSVTLPESVTTFGTNVYGYCGNLVSATLPANLSQIPNGTFAGCTSLSSITIPDGVVSIGSTAFASTSISSINLPAGLLTIGGSAFSDCASLTSLDLPDSLHTLGYNAFYNCDALTSISIPSTLTTVGSSAFGSCNLLASVVFEAGSTGVPANMFYNCPALTSVTLPAGMLTLGYGAFGGCTALVSISIPASVNNISDTAFENCSSLTTISVNAANTTYTSNNGVLFSEDMTVILKYPQGKIGSYMMPTSVTAIGSHCFERCIGLSAVTIPFGVTTIGGWAFRGCTGLTGVSLPYSVTTLGPWAFFGCDGLTSITVPSAVTSIGPSCFADCQQLTSILVESRNTTYSSMSGVLFDIQRNTLIACPAGKSGSYTVPLSVETIAESAFYGCELLTTIKLQSGINLIEDRAFYKCLALQSLHFPESATFTGGYTCAFSSSLTEVTLPTGITRIPDYMFTFCTSLQTIKIPEGVEVVGEGAFNECSGLLKVVLPASITELENESFRDCDNLTEVYFLGNAPSMGSSAYEATQIFYRWSGYPDVTIYYLSGSSGFSSPTWNEYNTAVIDQAVYPAASWLLSHNLGYDADLNQDLNGDGVKLLLAYALNLNPTSNNSGNLPTVQLNGSFAEMKFYGLSQGVTYQVYMSTDLLVWKTEGVTLSAPDGNGIVTASIPVDWPQAFMKLEVVED